MEIGKLRELHSDYVRYEGGIHGGTGSGLTNTYSYADGHRDFCEWLIDGFESFLDAIESLQAELENTSNKNKALVLANKRAYGDGFEDCEKAMGAPVVNLSDERDALQKELTSLAIESVERANALARLGEEVVAAAGVQDEQWAEEASDNTGYTLAYENGIYCVSDARGAIVCEFMRGTNKEAT